MRVSEPVFKKSRSATHHCKHVQLMFFFPCLVGGIYVAAPNKQQHGQYENLSFASMVVLGSHTFSNSDVLTAYSAHTLHASYSHVYIGARLEGNAVAKVPQQPLLGRTNAFPAPNNSPACHTYIHYMRAAALSPIRA